MSFERYQALIAERIADARAKISDRERALINRILGDFYEHVEMCGSMWRPVYVAVSAGARGLDEAMMKEAKGFKIGRLKSTGDLWIGSDIPKSSYNLYGIRSGITRTGDPEDITLVSSSL